MVGIILAAGMGTRLFPATKVINKNILPLYDKPVIYYSIAIMMMLEIYDVVIVCNKHEKEAYYNLLGNGEYVGINIEYVYQEKANGIVDAVLKCKTFVEGRDILLLLGDNFFYGQFFKKNNASACITQKHML